MHVRLAVYANRARRERERESERFRYSRELRAVSLPLLLLPAVGRDEQGCQRRTGVVVRGLVGWRLGGQLWSILLS